MSMERNTHSANELIRLHERTHRLGGVSYPAVSKVTIGEKNEIAFPSALNMTDENNQGREKHPHVRTDTQIIMNAHLFGMIVQSAVRTCCSFTHPLPYSKGICLHYGATSNAIKKKFQVSFDSCCTAHQSCMLYKSTRVK